MNKKVLISLATIALLLAGCSAPKPQTQYDQQQIIKSINNQLYENCDIIIDEYNFDYQLFRKINERDAVEMESKRKSSKGFEHIVALKATRSSGSSNEVNDYYVTFDLNTSLIQAMNSESSFIQKCR